VFLPLGPGAVFVKEAVALLGFQAAVRQLCELADEEADLVEPIGAERRALG
jgi:hypothetical protein